MGQLILGSEKFLNEVNRQIVANNIAEFKEFPREQRLSSKPSLDEIFQKEVRMGKTRDEIIYSTYYKYDFTQKAIEEYLGLHYTTISLAIKRYEDGHKRPKWTSVK